MVFNPNEYDERYVMRLTSADDVVQFANYMDSLGYVYSEHLTYLEMIGRFVECVADNGDVCIRLGEDAAYSRWKYWESCYHVSALNFEDFTWSCEDIQVPAEIEDYFKEIADGI